MSAIIPSVEVRTREDFALLCNARGLGVAVEVGVELGVNARRFLDRWHGRLILLIDPYRSNDPLGWEDRTPEMLIAIQALAQHHGRYYLIRGESLNIAHDYPHWLGMPQFVYLDGGHAYDDIRADLEAWWPVLEDRGILAGHDWDEELYPDIIRAVTEFAAGRGLVVRLTHERHLRSWYIYKTEPAELFGVSPDSPEDVAENPHASNP